MPELSLAEELSQQIDAAEQTETIEQPPETTEAAPVETEAQKEERLRDEKGRFAKAEEKTEETPTQAAQPTEAQATEQTQEQPPEAKPVAPPATWSAAAKAEFAKLPDVIRREVAKREQDFAKGIQQHAEKSKLADKFLNEFQPYEHIFRSMGATYDQFLRDSLATEYRLRTASPQEKTQLFLQYAHRYGADLSILPQLIGASQTQDGQPDINALVQQQVQQLVGPLAQRIQGWEQQVTASQRNAAIELEKQLQSQIDAFQSATDESGNPKNVFFENVRGAMSALIGSGQATSLEQAYEMACYANPEVRQALIAQQQSKAEAERLEEARRKAAEAKRASFDVSGQGGIGIADTSKLSLRDELSARLEGNQRL